MNSTKNLARPTTHNFDFIQDVLAHSTPVPDLLLANYQQLGLNEEQLVQFLRLLALVRGQLVFSAAELRGQFPEAESLLEFFAAKGLVTAEEGEGHYSLDGLFEQLWEIWCYAKSCAQKPATLPTDSDFAALCKLFEREMARGLSPMEAEKIDKWLAEDGFSGQMVEEALRRAVLQGKVSLNYIDRILLSWRKQNLRTLAEVMKNDQYGANKKTAAKTPKKKAPTDEYGGAYDKFLNS